ncbi:MAG TPA: LysM domain-containing protein [Smithella sp.]|nr:LysM domain-containing protein [Smithella sp.]
MNKRLVEVFVISVVLAFFCTTAPAKEDTAQMTLTKTAVSKNKLYAYTIKKGDILSSIIKSIPGISEKEIDRTYELIKELNPDISDFENLEPGQTIILPGKPATEPEVSLSQAKAEAQPAPSPAPAVETKPALYRIKRGDTLYNIIRTQLKVAEPAIPRTLVDLKKINPQIRNVNRIYAGDTIKLPGRTVFVRAPEETKLQRHLPAQIIEQTAQPGKIIEMKEKKILSLDAKLAVLKHVIDQLNGTVTTTGNYYLPIPKAGQVTIDCSKIPVVELDDNTVVFVDLENRAHSNLKKMLSDNWKNYFLVKAEKDESIISVIHKVINASKSYSMAKSEKPLTVGTAPQVEMVADWVIYKAHPQMSAKSAVQALRMIDENNLLLPNSIKNFFLNNALAVSEISEETGIVGKPQEIYALDPIPIFPTASVRDFSYALLTEMGMNAEKDVDVQLFDTVKDGFNLAIKADVLLTYENKKYAIYSQVLSEQFTNALKQSGHEPVFVKEGSTPQMMMEAILKTLNIPFTSEVFNFSGLERKQAPYNVRFPGTKIRTNRDLYVINFEMDEGLRGLLHEIWSANLARY